MYLVNFHKVKVGGKGGQLQAMTQAGLPCPAFKLVAFEAFDQEDFREQVESLINEYPNQDRLSQELQVLIGDYLQGQACPDLAQWLASYSPQQKFAVRSSASLEDQVDTSFAGQFASYLDVAAHQVVPTIVKVAQSLYSPQVLAYCRQHQLEISDLKMQVIIQEMVDATLSGVYFTANPKGLLNEHILVVGEGRGDGVVSDQVETRSYYYFPDDQLTFNQGDQGLVALTDQQIVSLNHQVDKLKEIFGPYLDIEFAYDQEDLYILQARPITGLQLPAQTILDNSNIVESYPGVTLPLTYSFIQQAYSGIMNSLAQRIAGSNSSAYKKFKAPFEQMIYSYHSRIYYQLENWFAVLQLLPFSKKIIPIWKDMLGIRNLDLQMANYSVSPWDRLKIMVNIIKEFILIPRKMEDLNQQFKHFQAYFESHLPQTQSVGDLLDLYETLKDQVLRDWDLTFVNDLYAFVYTGLLKKWTGDQGIQGDIAGISHLSSMEPVRALKALVNEIQEQGYYDEIQNLADLSHDQISKYLNSQEPLGQLLAGFIDQYGDRAPEELKLETHTFRSHPQGLITMIQSLLKSDQQSSAEQEAVIQEPISFKSTNFITKFLRKRAILGIQNRESSRLNRTRLYGMTRTIFRQIGEKFKQAGMIQEIDLVFYLTYEEIQAISQGQKTEDLQELNQRRQETIEAHKKYPNLSRMVFTDQPFDLVEIHRGLMDSGQDSKGTYHGIGCAQGKVTGSVVVINNVSQVNPQQVKDKIIVTKMTDPGWVYLLTQAKGIIAEKGSLLSHTAIISRELGIPSIVNVKGATEIFHTGQVLSIDGTTGQIIVQDRKEG